MYTTKFADYNATMGEIIMSEETTLEVLLSNEFGLKVPTQFSNISPEDWAKYAFENNLEYVITFYKDQKPYATVSNTTLSISIKYYEEKENGLKVYLSTNFMKGYIDTGSKDNGFVPYDNNKIFLSQIDRIGGLGQTILFYSQKKKNNVFSEEFTETNGNVELVEQFGTADLSKHWFDTPKNYLDYEALLDYQNLFNQLPSVPA
ncbi:hypothetical protein WH221_02620 [Chryseobacterium culicis]|uniref:Uncharacterized protein n=1 Tax=Chryseobacterium culicis TaxID=680127 RepID=A0A2S9CXC0_CHRCI|nr:hypothetical protein [Chryseobacterium culicis]PRB85168.1 hypothetical protein CQ022_02560 [Chryseobacterium culicis]PRB91109.1 hypothetical protein CQ033_10430 [Chryseobacterium culicis]